MGPYRRISTEEKPELIGGECGGVIRGGDVISVAIGG